MNMNDCHHYISPNGPGWYHLCVAIQDDDTLAVLLDYMWALSVLVKPVVDREWMDANRTKWIEALARAERWLPSPEIQAILNHTVIEIWDQIYEWGPAFTTWTYVFERMMAALTRKLTDRSRPEHSMTTNWVTADCMARARPVAIDRLRREVQPVSSVRRDATFSRVLRHLGANVDHRVSLL